MPANDVEGALREIRKAGFDETDPDSILHATDWMIENGYSDEVIEEVRDKSAELSELVEEHGPQFRAWIENQGSSYADASRFEDAFRGEYDSLADYVEEYWNEAGGLQQPGADQWWHPLNYVDWERMAEELVTAGNVWTADAPNGRIYVFDNDV